MNGCNNCLYGNYDHDTGFYNCSREDYLTEKDTDDLTETGGANCSQFKIDQYAEKIDEYYNNLMNAAAADV